MLRLTQGLPKSQVILGSTSQHVGDGTDRAMPNVTQRHGLNSTSQMTLLVRYTVNKVGPWLLIHKL